MSANKTRKDEVFINILRPCDQQNSVTDYKENRIQHSILSSNFASVLI